MEDKKEAAKTVKPYRNRIISTIIAIIIVFLLFSIGFFKTLFVAIVIAIGYLIGVYRDDPIKFFGWVEKLADLRDN